MHYGQTESRDTALTFHLLFDVLLPEPDVPVFLPVEEEDPVPLDDDPVLVEEDPVPVEAPVLVEDDPVPVEDDPVLLDDDEDPDDDDPDEDLDPDDLPDDPPPLLPPLPDEAMPMKKNLFYCNLHTLLMCFHNIMVNTII